MRNSYNKHTKWIAYLDNHMKRLLQGYIAES